MAKPTKKIIEPERKPLWKPQEGPQLDACLATWCNEMLFGGSRGGGKTAFLLGDFLQDVPTYGSAWKGILFRRSFSELEEVIRQSKDWYPQAGGEYFIQAKEWRFPNGATLRFAYLERDSDAEKYQGHQYSWIGWDELGNYPSDAPYKMLTATLRSTADVPTKRIRASANPGGPGHHWVYSHFISAHPRGYTPIDDPISGMSRMFIPSRVEDNKILMAQDPGYVNRLRAVGSPALVRAWLEGDWSAIQGAFFEEFNPAIHVIRPFEVPEYWPKWRAVDWGYAKPFSVLWMTISDNSMEEIPSGSVIVYREWYGCSAPNTGIRLPVNKFAEGIRDRTPKGEKIDYTTVDPSMFVEDGGPSMAEILFRQGVPCIRADNKRIPGWNYMRTLMRTKDGPPKFYMFSTCEHGIRTIPIMQHDKDKSEDLDSETDDHWVDSCRYGLMSRISPRNKPKDIQPFLGMASLTLKDLWKHRDSERKNIKRF